MLSEASGDETERRGHRKTIEERAGVEMEQLMASRIGSWKGELNYYICVTQPLVCAAPQLVCTQDRQW